MFNVRTCGSHAKTFQDLCFCFELQLQWIPSGERQHVQHKIIESTPEIQNNRKLPRKLTNVAYKNRASKTHYFPFWNGSLFLGSFHEPKTPTAKTSEWVEVAQILQKNQWSNHSRCLSSQGSIKKPHNPHLATSYVTWENSQKDRVLRKSLA